MKMIVSYTVGDECTYSCDMNTPIEYDSVEEAQYEFELRIEEQLKYVSPMNGGFWLGGSHFYFDNFIIYNRDNKKYYMCLPQIEELNDWFDRRMIEEKKNCPGY